MSSRELNEKDIDIIKKNLFVSFNLKEERDYEISKDEYGYFLSMSREFNKKEDALNLLQMISQLFCNFGYCFKFSHNSNTHDEEPVTLKNCFEYIESLKKDSQYDVSEKTVQTSSIILNKVLGSLNSKFNKITFNKSGNVEIYSDSNKYIWIDLFVSSNKMSIVCKDEDVKIIYPRGFDLKSNICEDTMYNFISAVCSSQ